MFVHASVVKSIQPYTNELWQRARVRGFYFNFLFDTYVTFLRHYALMALES